MCVSTNRKDPTRFSNSGFLGVIRHGIGITPLLGNTSRSLAFELLAAEKVYSASGSTGTHEALLKRTTNTCP